MSGAFVAILMDSSPHLPAMHAAFDVPVNASVDGQGAGLQEQLYG